MTCFVRKTTDKLRKNLGKNMEKNSSFGEQKLSTREWRIGDLVKISSHDWDATPYNHGLGVIVSVEQGRLHKQMDLFPMVSVYNFNTHEVDKLYSYNVEIVSPRQ